MPVKNAALMRKVAPIAVMPLLFAQHAMADMANKTASGTTLEEIIVTATRQSVGSQSTPLSLTAVSGDELAQNGITSLNQMNSLAPSMYVQSGLGDSPRFSLRGISSSDPSFNGASPVAIYIDDVYQTAIYGVSSQLFDLDRVEVLRGPQGTLFGKNTTGGAVSYFSKAPVNQDEGYVSFHIAQDHQSERTVEGVINTPLVDNQLALRVAFNTQRLSDYVHDAFSGRDYGAENSQTIRTQLQWTPSDTTTVNLLVAANDHHGTSPIFHAQLLPNVCDPAVNGGYQAFCDAPGVRMPYVALNPDSVALSDMSSAENFNSQNIVLRVYQTFPGFTLTSISHYRRGHYSSIYDGDGSAPDYLGVYTDHKSQQTGEELRISTDPAKRISAVVGGYYQHDRLREASSWDSILGSAFDFNMATYDYNYTDTYALFGNATFHISDQWSVVAGVRKSRETKTLSGRTDYYSFGTFDFTPQNVLPTGTRVATPSQTVPLVDEVKSSPLTWDGTVNYHPVDNLLMFVRVARSFRSGGFNGATFIDPSGATQPVYLHGFKPETVTSYEAGIKSEWLNHTLRVNAGVYHYDYKDQQVGVFQNNLSLTDNAGTSKVDGAELEIKALPVERLEVGANLGYTRARYVHYTTVATDPLTGLAHDVDYSGHTLNQAPKLTANAMVAYRFDVSDRYVLRPSTSWSYRSRIYFDASNDPALGDGALTQGSVRLDLEPRNEKGASFGFFVNNVTNKRYFTYAISVPPVLNEYTYNTAGRQYGIDMKYQW